MKLIAPKVFDTHPHILQHPYSSTVGHKSDAGLQLHVCKPHSPAVDGDLARQDAIRGSASKRSQQRRLASTCDSHHSKHTLNAPQLTKNMACIPARYGITIKRHVMTGTGTGK